MQITAVFDSIDEMLGFAGEILKSDQDEKTYTLIEVRAKLADLNKAGKKAKVQELISSFGVERLSLIGEEHYAELMQKAGEL